MNESKLNFQLLFDFTLPMTKKLLQAESEFIPFGARLDVPKKVSLVMGDVGVERPKSMDVVDFLSRFYREEAKSGKIVSAVICYMGERSSQDVAVFNMSDISGDAISVFLPYELSDVQGATFGTIFASKEERNFLF